MWKGGEKLPDKRLRVAIVTASEKLFEGDAKSVTYPGAVGEGQILPGHAPMTCLLGGGTLLIDGNGNAEFEIERGVLSVDADRVEGLVRKR